VGQKLINLCSQEVTRKLPMPCHTLLYPSNVKIKTKKLPTPCHAILCPPNVKIETKKSRLPPINSGQRTHIHEDKKHIETTHYKERGSQNNQDVEVLQFYLLIFHIQTNSSGLMELGAEEMDSIVLCPRTDNHWIPFL